MGAVDVPLYHHAGGAMLRAAVLPVDRVPDFWPTLADPGSCRSWLRAVWALPGFATAIRYASSSFADTVEEVLAEQITNARQVRRVTLSVLRYVLRAVGRPSRSACSQASPLSRWVKQPTWRGDRITGC